MGSHSSRWGHTPCRESMEGDVKIIACLQISVGARGMAPGIAANSNGIAGTMHYSMTTC